MSNTNLYKIKQDFLNEWPIERLKTIPLEEYTNLDKTSFCYWLEAITTDVGSIWGGSAYKFGVFKRDNLEKGDYKSAGRTAQGDYGWYSKYGDTRDEAYHKVKETVIEIAQLSQQNNLDRIEKIDFGNGIKWKIAFLYGDYNTINVFKHKALKASARYLGYQGKDKSYVTLNKFILAQKGNKDYFDFSKELWNVFDPDFKIADTEQELAKTLLAKKDMKYWIYAPGENASHWDDFYNEGIMGLGWDDLGDLNQYETKDDVVKELQKIYKTKSSKKNDSSANWDFKDTIKEGDIIIPKRGKKEYLGYGIVTSAYYYDETRKTYQKCRKVDWKKNGVWKETEQDIVLKTLTDVTSYNDYVDRLIKLIGIEESEKTYKDKNMGQKTLNTILYGPPGTGKTYKLRNEYFPKYTTKESTLSQEQYEESIIIDLTWWQVLVLVLSELEVAKVNEILEHPWMQIKARQSESKNVRAVIWGQLQTHTIIESETVRYTNRQAPYVFNKLDNSQWELLREQAQNDVPELLELAESIKKFEPSSDKEIKRYVFTTFHQSLSYEDFIEGIKPVMGSDAGEGSIQYDIQAGIFKQLCTRARNDPQNRYAIFIDEINRGNVSAIFGELITLIESDKREGMPNAMSAQLPYSKQDFSVPANLDIYGTMNTADRSVEALDSALRRRFSFEELRPNAEVLTQIDENATDVEGVNLVELLETINERIELLLDKDHQIGHSYFIGVKSVAMLREVFTDKVFPLLEEYFFGDIAKIGLVVGGEFLKETDKKDKVQLAANFAYEEKNLLTEKKVYQFTGRDTWTAEAFISIYNTAKES
jgi:5-methylcytosine-specific restriction endonuclease McrBC GTP-binding regulatory subunit McrB